MSGRIMSGEITLADPRKAVRANVGPHTKIPPFAAQALSAQTSTVSIFTREESSGRQHDLGSVQRVCRQPGLAVN